MTQQINKFFFVFSSLKPIFIIHHILLHAFESDIIMMSFIRTWVAGSPSDVTADPITQWNR